MFLDLDNTKKISADLKESYKSDPVKLYKDLKEVRLSAHLEQLDPTPEGCKLDAFERHLVANDIKISGPEQLTIGQLSDKAEYLLPEMILRSVEEGSNSLDERFSYKDCVAEVVPAKTMHYHPLYIPSQNLSSIQSRRDKSLGRVDNKGGGYPVFSIRTREKDITIEVGGKMVEASYNLIKDYGWSDFAIFLRLIGAQIAADKLQEIYDLAINGDGTVAAATNTFNGVAGTLSYSDLTHNFISFSSPFSPNRIMAPVTSLETILNMAQFQDPMAGFEFQKTGKLMTPMGCKLKQVNVTTAVTPVATVFASLDARFAVREVVYQKLQVEAEKIINRSFEAAAITEASRFCVIADGALTRCVWT
jgi:hypothetical protein